VYLEDSNSSDLRCFLDISGLKLQFLDESLKFKLHFNLAMNPLKSLFCHPTKNENTLRPTYGVHERPQSHGAVHAASRHHDVCSEVEAAADGLGPERRDRQRSQQASLLQLKSVTESVPEVSVHAVESFRQRLPAAAVGHLHVREAAPLEGGEMRWSRSYEVIKILQ